MNYYLLISAILVAIGGLFSLTRQLQMLQQNSYFPSRYAKWLIANFSVTQIFVFFVSSSLLALKLYLTQLIFIAVYLIISIVKAINIQKKSIKKLVFTSRVKRLYSAAALLFLLLLTVGLSNIIAVLTLFLFAILSPITCLIAWCITNPIEKAFTKWYIADAKRILKSNKNLKVIGITGSYGKTTTKFILTRILSEKYNTVCTPQSFNTPMGVVRTIREQLKPQTEIFVCEMGAKNIGDIKEICDIVNPDYALITSVGPQHLETFKTVDNVYNTKFELSDAIEKNGGNVFVNGDSKEIISRIDKTKYCVFGTDTGFNCYAHDISYGRNGSEFTINLNNEKIALNSKLLGLHSIINITGACALAYSLGVSADDIKYAVASLKPTEHRLEMKSSVNGSVMIDDAYNANPEGSIEAVHVLGSFDGMKKIIITPGLIELGDKEYDYNFALGLECAKICDIIIFVGENRSKPLSDAVLTTDFDKNNMFIAKSFQEAYEIYSRFANKDTVLLIENDLPDNYLN